MLHLQRSFPIRPRRRQRHLSGASTGPWPLNDDTTDSSPIRVTITVTAVLDSRLTRLS